MDNTVGFFADVCVVGFLVEAVVSCVVLALIVVTPTLVGFASMVRGGV